DYYAGEPQPPLNPPPPAGLTAPTLGFGKVWRDNPEVRQKLGWALAGERGVSKDNYQFFALGFMVRDGGKVYGVYEFTKFWSVFDDRYVP
ncbi:MAG TPA: hypothetical protein VM409_03150, partial [Chloroflexia bacterium]|nr:hypothetical protein [Chloroflexia bacterium]